ncbi:MAG: thioredoxin domain-containing protein [Bacteriovoracaceae bacterium]|nr:thioredoxin domain-containing protein [Bacteriovoracaceae bacterium]
MKNVKFGSVLGLVLILSLASCMNKDSLKKTLKENPEILYEAIKADPAEFMMVLQEAAQNAKGAMQEKKAEAEKKAFEESFSNPLKPQIRDDESIRGTKGGPLVLIEYSDFECPFCSRGFETVTKIMEKYEGKVQFIYKHLPLSFHPAAMISAQYYEAIRLQSEEKAFKFHDAIFANQRKLKNGKSFLDAEAKKLGVNMKKLGDDVNSESIKKRINEDMEEAAKFGIQGTPGFVLNGIPVKGAYPLNHFVKIVDELQKRDLVKL